MGKWGYIAVGPDDSLYVSNLSQVNFKIACGKMIMPLLRLFHAIAGQLYSLLLTDQQQPFLPGLLLGCAVNTGKCLALRIIYRQPP